MASPKDGSDGSAVGKMMGVGVATSLDGPSGPHANPTHATKMAGTKSIFGMQSSWTGLGSLVEPHSSAALPYMFALASEEWVVAHTGFEPVISALRGRCPWPLDECATA